MASRYKRIDPKLERANMEPALTYNHLCKRILYEYSTLASITLKDVQTHPEYFTAVMRRADDYINEVSNYNMHGDIELLFNKLVALYNKLYLKHFG